MCAAQSVAVGAACTPISTVVGGVAAAAVAALAVSFGLYAARLRRLAAAHWRIGAGELHFDDPPVVLGVGSCGQVASVWGGGGSTSFGE